MKHLEISQAIAQIILEQVQKNPTDALNALTKIISEHKQMQQAIELIHTASVGLDSIPMASTKLIQEAVKAAIGEDK
jgi:hypothetical protein